MSTTVVDDGRERILLAVQRLRAGIDKLLQRASKRREIDPRHKQAIHHLTSHIQHLLIQLLERRNSLQSLITWFRNEWRKLESKLAQYPQQILEHAMKCLVRCQDGLVLLTSGECRHPVDIQQAKKTKFQSRLKTLKERGDGYTMLYNTTSDYSGYGWDEYANETVGIQARLVKILKAYHKDPWDYLERNDYTQMLDVLLSQQEDTITHLHHELQALKLQMRDDISKRLAKPTQFTTQDKMEKLEVTFQGRTIILARRADSFQLTGVSVLPNTFQRPEDWKHVESLKLTEFPVATTAKRQLSGPKRRRLAIQESDSEDEGQPSGGTTSLNANKAKSGTTLQSKSTSTGLVVQVSDKQSRPETEDSLVAIKAQMGVDVKALETSREDLERENGNNVNHSLENERDDLEIRRYERALQRAEQRSGIDRDEFEIWDARECLRQAYMEAGNQSLWSTNRKNLKRAQHCFEQAKKLATQQQESHNLSVAKTNDNTDESKVITRNLLFLLAQATVNVGITLLEARQAKSVNDTNIQTEMNEFRSALRLSEELRDRAKEDLRHITKGSARNRSSSEYQIVAQLDMLEAAKLESLACRWMGIAQMSVSTNALSCSNAMDILERGRCVFSGFDLKECENEQILLSSLEVAVEAIYSASTQAELAATAIKRVNRAARETEGEKMMKHLRSALRKQIEIEQAIENLAHIGRDPSMSSKVQEFCEENNVSRSSETQSSLNEIENWWDTILRQPHYVQNMVEAPRLPRSDLDLTNLYRGEPTARFLASEGVRHRRKQRQKAEESSRGNQASTSRRAYSDRDNIQRLERNQKTIRFRKWGDQLLPNVLNGGSMEGNGTAEQVPRLAYPSIPPPLPEKFKALLEAQGA